VHRHRPPFDFSHLGILSTRYCRCSSTASIWNWSYSITSSWRGGHVLSSWRHRDVDWQELHVGLNRINNISNHQTPHHTFPPYLPVWLPSYAAQWKRKGTPTLQNFPMPASLMSRRHVVHYCRSSPAQSTRTSQALAPKTCTNCGRSSIMRRLTNLPVCLRPRRLIGHVSTGRQSTACIRFTR